MRCGRCHEDWPPEARFCAACGERLDPDPGAAPAPRQPYTPAHLAELILTSRHALEGERKQVTVLFADLAGSTAMAARVGPDVMHGLLNAFFELAAEEIHRYEGTINQFLGDGLMALFGAPLAHEDHARRAALAALQIQRRLREHRDDRAAPLWPELGLRIGLNTGLVVVGKIGDNLRMDYTAVGDTTNLAARLQQLAAPGHICLSESTYRAVQPYVECELLGARRVKGKAEPVTVYRLRGVRPRPAPGVEPGRRPRASPLVEREDDVATLTGCVERLAGGAGGVVSVLGEAGVGKSRMLAEVRRAVAGRDIVWLEGRSVSFGQALSYLPFLEILRSWAGLTDAEDAAAWARLERRVALLFPGDHDDVLPYAATLMGIPVPGRLSHRVNYLDGQAMGRQIFRACRLLFHRLASERPLVLVFEDLHWSDASSASLIEHLLPLVETVPLLLCGVSRPDRQSPAARLRDLARARYGKRYTEIVLSPLSARGSAALVDNLLPGHELPLSLREQILRRTDGNPFFIEEVVRALVETRVLVRQGSGPWRVTVPLETIAIPETVQGVIMARVDRLREQVKQVLKLAAVIGRSFFYRVLRHVIEAEPDLDRHLDELQQAELIRERPGAPELEYVFTHALVQQAAYESLLADPRRRLHRRVAEGIERLFGDRLDEFHGVLAYHYARAEAWDKAHQHLFSAGDQAANIAGDTEALSHYRLAAEACARAFGDRWDSGARAELERKIGEALYHRSEHREALRSLHHALGLLGAPFPATGRAAAVVTVQELLRQTSHRLVPGLLRPGAPSLERADRERLRIYSILPWIDFFVDRRRFLLDILLLLNFSERRGFAGGAVEGCTGLGVILDHLGLFGPARRYHRRAVDVAEACGERLAIADAYLGLFTHEAYLGAFDAALTAGRRAEAAYRDVGELRGWGSMSTLMAIAHFLRGEVPTTLARAGDLVRAGQDGADPMLRGWGLYLQGRVLCQAGRLPEAVTALEEAVALYAGRDDHSGVADANGALGACYLRQGRIPEAVALLEENSRQITEHRLTGHQITVPLNALTEAYLAAAEHAGAGERDAYLQRAAAASKTALRQGRVFRGGLPHSMRIEGRRAWLTGRLRPARIWWDRARVLAEQLGMPYELAMAGVELAQRAGDQRHLARAERLLAELGVAPWAPSVAGRAEGADSGASRRPAGADASAAPEHEGGHT